MTLFSLSIGNVKHNFSKYFSYFISTLFSVFMLFMFFSIYFNKQIENFSSGRVKVYTIFKAASVLVIIFSALFIWYANSFFIKSRKKEMAIYSILGMKKKEIGILLFCENMFLGILAIIVGIPLGLVASKYMFKILLNIMKAEITITSTIDIRAILATSLIFLVFFIINSYKSYMVIYEYKLIELLSAEKEAEKAPTGSFILSLISIVMIIAGYVIAYRELLKGGSRMVYLGLLVLVLVVAGTYILFNNFIILMIKKLKRKKKLYYKGENLISISQILYRVKKNSSTLSTIAIASAVAITALGFTFGFYMSIERIPAAYSPFSLMYIGDDNALNNKVEDVINSHKEVSVTKKTDINVINGDGSTDKYAGPFGKSTGGNFKVNIISKSLYEDILKKSELSKAADSMNIVKKLNFTDENQCFFIEISSDSSKGRLKGDKVNINVSDKSFNLKIIDSDTNTVLGSIGTTTLVVPDSTYNRFYKINPKNILTIRGYSLKDSLKSKKLVNDLKEIIPEEKFFNSFYSVYKSTYELYGSYIFIGMFLGILFVLSTGSILYYKQLTEANADKPRYNILMKIGASKKELRHIITKQLALIFGLPLIIGIFHSTAALSVFIKFMNNNMFVIKCTAGVMGIYSLVYLFYYLISIRSYMKIIYSKS